MYGIDLAPLFTIIINCDTFDVLCSFTLVAPWLPKPKEDIEEKAFKGGDVSFECAARGFPLEVEWKVKRKDQAVQSCISKCVMRI